jgi:hypothetical protein
LFLRLSLEPSLELAKDYPRNINSNDATAYGYVHDAAEL